MSHRRLWSLLVICLGLSLNSCITILGSEMHKLDVAPDHNGVSVFLDGEPLKVNNDTTIELSKDQAHFVEFTKDSFQSERIVICKRRKTRLGLLDFVFAGAAAATLNLKGGESDLAKATLFGGAIYGLGLRIIDGLIVMNNYDKKTIMRPKKLEFPDLKEIPVRQDSSRYLFVNETRLEWEAKDQQVNYYKKARHYYNSTIPPKNFEGEFEIKGRSFELSSFLNRRLHEYGWTDTVSDFFRNNNSLYLDSRLQGVRINVVTSAFVEIEMSVEWKLKNAFEEDLLVAVQREKSVKYRLDAELLEIMENALDRNLVSFLGRDDVERIITSIDKKEEEMKGAWSTLNLSKRRKAVKSIGEATSATVTIETNSGLGSGCIISDEGYVVTNYHVVDQSETVKVILQSGQQFEGKVLQGDPDVDIALIKMKGDTFPYYNLERDSISTGTPVFAIGTPLSKRLSQSVSSGRIASVREFNGTTYYQLDAKISPGNSGGALIDSRGNLLGIVNAKMTGFGVEGIGFAIPVEVVVNSLKITQ